MNETRQKINLTFKLGVRHSTAENILKGLLYAVAHLKRSLALQLPMDGLNVLHDHVLREHNKTVLHIGSCSLDIIHNAFKTGCSAVQSYWLGYS
ncbi:hypothetical protein PR048_018638 [Dryococelus australis]|uniref:Uncharacterized protein n=1 Tax=Dryococelus australis TaxID=614101 RepID=A0ABQ9HCT0_9NEOP|nr:hypothetical protein PR048_018638 [Dryococelus australis]